MKSLLALLLFAFSLSTHAIEEEKTVPKRQNDLTTLDYSTIWLAEQDEIIGFIGDNYQRIRIRFLSVEQDKNNKTCYIVRGKSKVKDNICDFAGKIQVNEVRITETRPLEKAVILATYNLKEDTSQSNSGYFKGELTSYIYRENGKIVFDDLEWGISDPYNNNQFEGKWIHYITKQSKKCNWGIARIPDSGELDMGAGEFYPNPAYKDNGWDTYPDGGISTPSYEEQLETDRPQWWN